MKVKDLIAQLAQVDPDLEIAFEDSERGIQRATQLGSAIEIKEFYSSEWEHGLIDPNDTFLDLDDLKPAGKFCVIDLY